SPNGTTALFSLYTYWVVRLFIEALLFIALRQVIERYLPAPSSFALVTGLAILISLPPFALAITAFDIILGYPELGLESGAATPVSKLMEFGLELLYLSDNHLVLCLLLSLPRIIMNRTAPQPVQATEEAVSAPKVAQEVPPPGATILARIEPPLAGEVLWAEAQEHYVRLKTTQETRMVLQRFSDIL
ncbi:unnamed protein product, partial [Ectocarpus sp. 12 AP-2014]